MAGPEDNPQGAPEKPESNQPGSFDDQVRLEAERIAKAFLESFYRTFQDASAGEIPPELYEAQMAATLGEKREPLISGYESKPMRDMYAKERKIELQIAEDQPHMYLANKIVRVGNSGESSRVEQSGLMDVQGIPWILTDDEGSALKAMRMIPHLAEAKASPKYEALAEAAVGMNSELLVGWSRFRMPVIMVERVGEKAVEVNGVNEVRPLIKRHFALLSFGQVYDIIDSDPELRALYYSDNPDDMHKAEGLISAQLTLNLFGIKPEDFDRNKHRFYTVRNIPQGVAELSHLDTIDETAKREMLNSNNLVPWGPFMDEERIYDKRERRWRADFNNVVEIDNKQKLSLAFIWQIGGVDRLITAFGRLGVIDSLFGGRRDYMERATFHPDNYHGDIYHTLPPELIPFIKTGYTDVISENANVLFPPLAFLESAREEGEERVFFRQGLDSIEGENGLRRVTKEDLFTALGFSDEEKQAVNETYSKDEAGLLSYLKESVVDLRIGAVEFIFRSKYLVPWLEPYLDVLAKGMSGTFNKQVILMGFEGRYEKQKTRFDDEEVHFPNPLGSMVIDFGRTKEGYKNGLRFLTNNSDVSSKGWIRTKDEMRQVVQGLATYAPDLFRGMNFLPLWQKMGLKVNGANEYALSQTNLKALWPSVCQTIQESAMSEDEVRLFREKGELPQGFDKRRMNIHSNEWFGLLGMVEGFGFNSLHFEKLKRTDAWKFFYYLGLSYIAQKARVETVKSFNVAKPSRFEKPAGVKIGHASEEYAQIAEKMVQDLNTPGWQDLNQRAGNFLSLVVGLISNSAKHGSADLVARRFKVNKKGKGVLNALKKIVGYEGESWEQIPTSTDYGRPELGIIRRKIGGRKERLLGPGYVPVFEADMFNGRDIPSLDAFGGRPIGYEQLGEIFRHVADGTLVKSETTDMVLAMIRSIYGEEIPETVKLSKVEEFNETREIKRHWQE